jgi:hypothetical protein
MEQPTRTKDKKRAKFLSKQTEKLIIELDDIIRDRVVHDNVNRLKKDIILPCI